MIHKRFECRLRATTLLWLGGVAWALHPVGASATGLQELAGPPSAVQVTGTPSLGAPANPDDEAPGGHFLSANQAFQATWAWVGEDRLVGRFMITPGYYLYRDRLRVLAQDRAVPLDAHLDLPAGDTKDDPYFGPQQVFHQSFEVSIDFAPQTPGRARPAFDVLWQGCAEAGLCYPPQRKSFAATAR